VRDIEDGLIHELQADDGYSWKWHCEQKDKEIERLRRELAFAYADVNRLCGLLRVCMRRWVPFKEVDFRRTVMEAAKCNENGDEL
jgi:hypothetical protein